MRDHIEARLWANHGHQFSEDLHRLFAGTRDAFARLHALNWDAPWRRSWRTSHIEQEAAPPRLRLAGLAVSAVLVTIGVTIAASGALLGAAAALA
jgi:hypothetical protein